MRIRNIHDRDLPKEKEEKTEFVPVFAKSRNGSGREPIQPWNSSRTEGLQGSLNQAGVRMGKEQVGWLPRPPAATTNAHLHLQFSCTREAIDRFGSTEYFE